MGLSEVDKMCIQHNHEIETLEIETRLLELFRLYENGIKSELSDDEWKAISEEASIINFFSYAKERLLILLDREERGEKYA
jgi:hypothetical protein